jgi:hypothetical protein
MGAGSCSAVQRMLSLSHIPAAPQLRVAGQCHPPTICFLPYQPTGVCRTVTTTAACPSWHPPVSHLRKPLIYAILCLASSRCLPDIGANASSRFCPMVSVERKCLIVVLTSWRSYQLDPRKSKPGPVLPIARSLVVSRVSNYKRAWGATSRRVARLLRALRGCVGLICLG